MELALKDKVILVTGGAAGIGQEIVKKLHALEAIPIVVDRVKKVEAKWGQDSSTIPELQWITVDLVAEDQCRKAVSQIIDQFGRIDGLVNNAGVNDGIGLTSSLDQFRSSIEATVSASMPPLTTVIVVGSRGICPEIQTVLPTLTACE